MKHVLTGDELTPKTIDKILNLASTLKKEPKSYSKVLDGKHIALLFSKQSLRTRLSFTVAVHQLGGQIIESIGSTRKPEEPKDTIRVLQGYCQGVVIRTDKDSELEEMAKYGTIPIINALTDLYHPCQALADLLTLQTCFGPLSQLKIAFIGDGNNVLHSLAMMATKLGASVHICCPPGHEPESSIMHPLGGVKCFDNPIEAVQGCDAVYTDVWTSMGFSPKDESLFENLQVNEALMSQAKPHAVFMHCMPMERGKEVSESLPDTQCSVIFEQSENRLHVQKALLIHVFQKGE